MLVCPTGKDKRIRYGHVNTMLVSIATEEKNMGLVDSLYIAGVEITVIFESAYINKAHHCLVHASVTEDQFADILIGWASSIRSSSIGN